MRNPVCAFLFLTLPFLLTAQDLYFPPVGGEWETISSNELDWCQDSLASLEQFLDGNDTKAFMVLKDGKIVLEWYFDSFTQDSIWYWASAAKSLTSVLVGKAQEEGFLDISDRTSDYLGEGWTGCDPTDEEKITIRHQISMATGLDDGVSDNYCTLDTCLQCLTEPGGRWAYHNAPYTLLREVLEEATGMNVNLYFATRIGNPIGAVGLWIRAGYNNLFLSRARDMARFGLLVLADGVWDGSDVYSDMPYFEDMSESSQDINPSYGYLWWLSGKERFMVPGLQIQFPGSLIKEAPDDMFAALGKNDQKLYIVPSENMVIVRLGNAAGDDLPALSSFDNALWAKIGGLDCGTTAVSDPVDPRARESLVYPNPTSGDARIREGVNFQYWELYDQAGRPVLRSDQAVILLSGEKQGVYFLRIRMDEGVVVETLVKQE